MLHNVCHSILKLPTEGAHLFGNPHTVRKPKKAPILSGEPWFLNLFENHGKYAKKRVEDPRAQ